MPRSNPFTRQNLSLRPDPSRVIIRPFRPTTEPRDLQPTDKKRANHIVDRVLALSPDTAALQLTEVLDNFAGRHRDLVGQLDRNAGEMESALVGHPGFTPIQRQLVGAYFLQEYSFEASALFNPSIVPHPDQSGVPADSLRFVLSLRAVGEGHISSITFRTGLIGLDGRITMDPSARLAALPVVGRSCTDDDGEQSWLEFDGQWDISERVIFPVTARQSNGVEDVRFVAFEDEGRRTYLGTYTAYDGRGVRSEMIETSDFRTFRMMSLAGDAPVNKGMALFPRRINGRYAMIGRQDNENLYLIYSDDLRTWNGGQLILAPRFPWEFVQIGNCGAPIELDQGWLMFTHGVGPIRKYSIGAVLLDRDDPSRVLARTREPLIRPDPSEREGYVPNVVYSCGALRFGDRIVLPYAISDSFTNFASAPIQAILDRLEPVG